MSNQEKDYSAYISYHLMASNLFSLFMGFTFTSIVVLLTWVVDPGQIRIQTVLFFLVLLFHVLGFLLFAEEALLAYCVRTAPLLPKNYRGGWLVHQLSNFVWYMLAGIIVLMFAVWNLIYLAVLAAVVGISLILLARRIVKPFYEAVGEWART